MPYLTIDPKKPLKPNALVNMGALTAAGLFGYGTTSVFHALGAPLTSAGVATLAIPCSSITAACLSGAFITLIPHIVLHHFIDTSKTLNQRPNLKMGLELALFAASIVGAILIGALITHIAAPLLGALVIHGVMYGAITAIILGLTATAATSCIKNTSSFSI